MMTTLMQQDTIAPDHATQKPALTRRIVLTGFMGAGKTTVGKLLADRLGRQFADTDADVEKRFGLSIAEMFSTEGEAEFRRRESHAVAHLLGRQDIVIALGGGAPESLTTRLLLEQTGQTLVVFLDAPLEVLLERCARQGGAAVRPVLANPDAAARRFRERRPLYHRCAHARLDTAGHTPQATAEAVLSLLENLSRQ